MDRMRDENGRLFHSRRAGKRLHRGTLDDYANMARAGVALFEATGETAYLDEAQGLVAVLDRHFADPRGRRLLHHRRRCRRPDRAHQALPRQRLARRQRHAGRRLRAAVGADGRRPLARQGRAPGRGLRGRAGQQLLPAHDPAQRLRDAAERHRAGDRRRSQQPPRPKPCAAPSMPTACPTRSSAACRPAAPSGPSSAAGKGLVDGKPALYVCRNMTCEAPVIDPGAFRFSEFPTVRIFMQLAAQDLDSSSTTISRPRPASSSRSARPSSMARPA